MVKFRGKRKDNGEVAFGSLVFDAINNPRIAVIDYSGDGLDFHKVIPETVGMFTTLLDKNGKEIYGSIPINGEMSKGGDEIRVYEKVGEEIKGWTNEVCFKQGCFSLVDRDCCEVCKNGFGITMNLDEAFHYGDVEIVAPIYEKGEKK